jgi:hypothetical protein
MLAGQFELAPQGETVQDYVIGMGYDLGTPVPVTTLVTGMMLDGDRQSGLRTGNKTVTLPVIISADSRIALSQMTDALMEAVNAPTFTLQWTPEGGLPVIWDCYRATPKIAWDVRLEDQAGGTICQREVDLTCSAAPFGRSPDAQTVAATQTPALLDNFSTAPTGAYLDSTISTDPGGSSARVYPWWGWTNGALQPATGQTIARNFATSMNLNGYASAAVRVLHQPKAGSATLTLTLALNTGTISAPVWVTATGKGLFSSGVGTFNSVAMTLPDIDLSAVVGYRLNVLVTPSAGQNPDFQPIWFDELFALGPSSTRLSTPHGAVVAIPDIAGSARAPANLTCTSPVAGLGMLLHRPPIDQDPNLQILTALPPVIGMPAVIGAPAAAFGGTYSAVLAAAPVASGSHTTVLTVTQTIGPNLAPIDTATAGEATSGVANFGRIGGGTTTFVTPGLAGSTGAVKITNAASAVTGVNAWGVLCGQPSGTTSAGLTPVVAGQPYTAQVLIGGGSASCNMNLTIGWYDQNFNLLAASTPPPSFALPGTGQTVRATCTGSAPAGAYWASVRIRNSNTVPASMAMTVDDIQVEVGSAASPFVPPVRIGSATLSATWTSSANTTAAYVVLGDLNLPLSEVEPGAAFNLQAVLADTQLNVYTDLMLLDTTGETVLVNQTPVAFSTLYVDEPDPRYGIGSVNIDFGGQGRTTAASAAAQALISGGPIALEPGTNSLLAHALAGPPTVSATIYPRWQGERST